MSSIELEKALLLTQNQMLFLCGHNSLAFSHQLARELLTTRGSRSRSTNFLHENQSRRAVRPGVDQVRLTRVLGRYISLPPRRLARSTHDTVSTGLVQ